MKYDEHRSYYLYTDYQDKPCICIIRGTTEIHYTPGFHSQLRVIRFAAKHVRDSLNQRKYNLKLEA